MPTIFPVIRYRDAHAAIDWLVRVFGFEQRGVVASPDGGVAHAELAFGPSVIGLSSAPRTVTDHPWSRVRQGVYVHVSEVDAHHDRAKAAGATIATPLTDMDYGSREYSVLDPGGHLWGFGTYDMSGGSGEPTIFPELHYDKGDEAVAFLTRAFGFEPTLQVRGKVGDVMDVIHGELRFGRGFVMVGAGDAGAETWGDLRQCQHVWLPNPDEHFARAQSGGATIVDEPRDTPWKSRGYYVRDLEGLLWGFSNYMPGTITNAG